MAVGGVADRALVDTSAVSRDAVRTMKQSRLYPAFKMTADDPSSL